MDRQLPDTATHVAGVKLSPWTAVPGADYCAMRFIDGTDPADIANRVAFIEKTPRVRVRPFNDLPNDWQNWHQGWKGDYWCDVSQGWCDTHLQALGYTVPDAKPFSFDML